MTAAGRHRLLTILVALMIPTAVLMTTWSGLHRHLLAEELQTLEHEQAAWLEQNKRLLTSIAIYRSPQRIAELAERDLGLEPIAAGRLTIIEPAAPVIDGPAGGGPANGDQAGGEQAGAVGRTEAAQ